MRGGGGGALWALSYGYLRACSLGPLLQVLWSPEEPPLNLQVHWSRAALESAGHLHILPFGRSHVSRKLGKFCCKTEMHRFGVSTPALPNVFFLENSTQVFVCLAFLFRGPWKKKIKTAITSPYDIPVGLLIPIALPLHVLFLVSCLNHFVVDQVQIMERLMSLPIALSASQAAQS